MRKLAVVCFTIDDVYPGILKTEVLTLVTCLLKKHPLLKVTLFVTPDWREMSPIPTRNLIAAIPIVRDYFYLARIHPQGTFRLDRHPQFVSFLKELPRTEIALHGLHHIHKGVHIPVEFQKQSKSMCVRMLCEALNLFEAAGLPPPIGMAPPGWNAPLGLIKAMGELGFLFLASARDIRTPVSNLAVAQMSGLKNMPLYRPQLIAGEHLIHIPTNFQATSPKERAFEILEMGGLLSIKAHAIKNAYGHIALDGLDRLYFNYLDTLFSRIEDRYGDSIRWATMGEISALY